MTISSSKKWSWRKPGFFLAITLGGLASSLLFVNCSGSPFDPTPVTKEGELSTITKLSEVPYSVDSSDYTVENYKLAIEDGPVYFQFVSACSTKCPVVVASLPYTGISWSNDPLDLIWAAKDPSGTGILTADVNGPNYVPGSGDVIAYYNSSVNDAVGFGGIFLKSGVSTILVYNRFYLGRKLNSYANDFAHVLNNLSHFSTIDTTRVALLGASLGGFVALHGSRSAKVKPNVVVGITPLLDAQTEYDFMSSVNTRITSNPNLLTSSQNFFRSYLRRLDGVQSAFT